MIDPTPTVGRRGLLLGGVAGLGGLLLGCAPAPAPTAGAPTTTAPTTPTAGAVDTGALDARLTDIENRFGGRLGVCALDTATMATVAHRGDERFLMCSTAKVATVSTVLRRAGTEPGLLDRRITYGRADLLAYAPVTSRNVATGMTVTQLCDAALTVSDNTAENLLQALVGGPAGVTAFVRGLGDPLTRFDRTEPTLNDTGPGDERDTTTPSWFVRDLRTLALGDALPTAARDRLVAWMTANTTGAEQIRAGVPAGWRVADKTGSGAQGESNDVGVVRPPGRAPIVVTVYTAPDDPANTTGKATIAAATAAVVGALVAVT